MFLKKVDANPAKPWSLFVIFWLAEPQFLNEWRTVSFPDRRGILSGQSIMQMSVIRSGWKEFIQFNIVLKKPGYLSAIPLSIELSISSMCRMSCQMYPVWNRYVGGRVFSEMLFRNARNDGFVDNTRYFFYKKLVYKKLGLQRPKF